MSEKLINLYYYSNTKKELSSAFFNKTFVEADLF
jgi:hypothetical protein